jgi:uncharacterized lipoprotein YddW (UPF0748 family)
LLGSLCLCAPVFCSTGCATTPALRDPIRAVWVTRGDYRTAEDVKQIMSNCAAAGFNTVLFQVRGNGTAFYPSSFEPWADELGGQAPGWDPLALAVTEAHALDLDLHAWVNVMPAWRGKTPPTNPEQLYNKRPQWFWYDQNGARQALCDFYVSLNPCREDVRLYLVGVFEEIAREYEIDGLHLDYIRFPNEPPATPRGSGLDYPYDAETLSAYRQATGKAPQDDKEAWNRWRTEQVTILVADIHAMLRRTRPTAALTAANGSVRERALTHFQDARAWVDQGVIDALFLMNYTDDPEEFSRRIDPWIAGDPNTAIVPGAWFGRHAGKPREDAVAAVRRQLELAVEKTGDLCVFSYGSMFARGEAFDATGESDAAKLRAIRREAVTACLKELAAARAASQGG